MQSACSKSLPLTSGKQTNEQTQTPQRGITGQVWPAMLPSPASSFPHFPSSPFVHCSHSALSQPGAGCVPSPLGVLDQLFLKWNAVSTLLLLLSTLSLQSLPRLSFLRMGWGGSWKCSPNNQYILQYHSELKGVFSCPSSLLDCKLIEGRYWVLLTAVAPASHPLPGR